MVSGEEMGDAGGLLATPVCVGGGAENNVNFIQLTDYITKTLSASFIE